MTKKDKLFLLIFILSCLSIFIAIPLKLYGIDLFNIKILINFMPLTLEYVLNNIISMIQFFLIIGCITLLEPKKLAIKILPFLPLTILIYYFPIDAFLPLCLIVLLATCMAVRPQFSTFILFIFNIIFISIIQLILIWLKLDIINFSPIFPDFINLVLLHIDEFIILGFLYYVNRKWGEKFAKLVIFWKNGQ